MALATGHPVAWSPAGIGPLIPHAPGQRPRPLRASTQAAPKATPLRAPTSPQWEKALVVHSGQRPDSRAVCHQKITRLSPDGRAGGLLPPGRSGGTTGPPACTDGCSGAEQNLKSASPGLRRRPVGTAPALFAQHTRVIYTACTRSRTQHGGPGIGELPFGAGHTTDTCDPTGATESHLGPKTLATGEWVRWVCIPTQ